MLQDAINAATHETHSPRGFTWVKRFQEADPLTGELKEVDECRALMLLVVTTYQDGTVNVVGLTNGPDPDDPVIPAPEAEGFVGYEEPFYNGRAKTGERIREVAVSS